MARTPGLAIVLAALLAALALPASAGAFTVEQVQVTQGVQDAANSVPLVADRGTAIRVRVRSDPGDTVPAGGIVGALRVFVDNVEVTPTGGVTALNGNATTGFVPLPFAPSLDDFDENTTMNFELPAPSGIKPAAGAQASSNVDLVIFFHSRTAFAANPQVPGPPLFTTTMDNLTVRERGRPRIHFVPLAWEPVSTDFPDPSFIAPGRGDAMVRGVTPVDDSGATTYEALPALSISGDVLPDTPGSEFTGPITFNEDEPATNLNPLAPSYVLSKLQLERQMLTGPGGIGPNRLVHVYGWFPQGVLSGHAGMAMTNANIGYGLDTPDDGQKIFAHEFGHMVGLPHDDPSPATLAPNVGWDVGGRLVGNPNANLVGGRVKRSTTEEYMSAPRTQRTNGSWIDEANYRTMLDDPGLRPTGGRNQVCDGLLLRFRNLAGLAERLSLPTLAVTAFPWCPVDEGPGGVSAYAAEVRYQPGVPSACVRRTSTGRCVASSRPRPGERPPAPRVRRVPIPDSQVHGDPFVGDKLLPERPGPAMVPVQVPPGSTLLSMRVIDRRSGRVVLSRRRSRNPPRVAVRSPRSASALSGRVSLAWRASDRDSGDELLSHVAWSPNGGRHWFPVAADVTGGRVEVDAGALPRRPGGGGGILRFFVDDGLQTTYTDVTGLRVRG